MHRGRHELRPARTGAVALKPSWLARKSDIATSLRIPVQGAGEGLVLTEGRAADVTALLAALRLPDDTTTVEIYTAEMPWVPKLLVLDAQGRWIRPGLAVADADRLADLRDAICCLMLTTPRPG
jgi:hypothetical protein